MMAIDITYGSEKTSMAPTIEKTLVCLANSRKLSGRCIAGRELNNGRPGAWIRPVSDRECEEVSEYERQFQNGSDPKPLDIISMQMIKPKPKGYQTENWLLDPEYYWEKDGCIKWGDLESLTDPVDHLWAMEQSTVNGKNDKIDLVTANSHGHSLRLVKLPELTISVFAPGKNFGNMRRRVQARFWFNQHEYWLWVTDPYHETKYLRKKDGDHKIGECYVVISIGEPFGGYCYKLVATILDRKRYGA